MLRLQDPGPFRPLLISLAAALLLAPALGADWLITLEGKLIETEGSWTIEGETLTYADVAGETHQIALDDVDLEASEETTALKAGKPYVPRPEPEAPEVEAPAAGAPAAAQPKVTLYMTSWCGYCRKTRQLLTSLDVPFVEKDIEKDPEAHAEYSEKAGSYRGIPLVDVDGHIVKGYRATLIHKLVVKLRKQEAAAGATRAPGS